MDSRRAHGVTIALACSLLLGAFVGLMIPPHVSAGTAVVFSEDFESGTIGARWNSSDLNAASGLDFWGISTYRINTGNYSAWCAENGTQSDTGQNNSAVHQYDDNMQADLVIDLRVNGFTSLVLSFYYYSKTENGGGDFLEAWYVAGGVSTMIFQNRGTANWASASVPVPNNVEQLVVRFTSDGANHGFEGAYVDDILLTGTESIPPTSSVSPLPPYSRVVPYFVPYTALDNANASGVDYVELWWRMGSTGNFALYSLPANPQGRWHPWVSPAVPFDTAYGSGDGRYEFYTVAVDNASNAEAPPATADASITIDTVAPTITIAEPTANLTTEANTITVSWTASDVTSGLDHFDVWMDTDAPARTTNTTLTVTGIPNGAHTFHVVAVDRAGNRKEATVDFTVNANPYVWAWWLLLILVAVFVGLFLFWFWRRREQDKERTKAGTDEEPAAEPEGAPSETDESGNPPPESPEE